MKRSGSSEDWIEYIFYQRSFGIYLMLCWTQSCTATVEADVALVADCQNASPGFSR